MRIVIEQVVCQTCGGEGWLWTHDHPSYRGPDGECADDEGGCIQHDCSTCGGSGKEWPEETIWLEEYADLLDAQARGEVIIKKVAKKEPVKGPGPEWGVHPSDEKGHWRTLAERMSQFFKGTSD